MNYKKSNIILKNLRKRHGLTQKELAEKVGLTQQAVALIENGQRRLDMDLFLKILDILNESIIDIIPQVDFQKENDFGEKIFDIIEDETEKAYISLLHNLGYSLRFNKNNCTYELNCYEMSDDKSPEKKTLIISAADYLKFQSDVEDYISFLINKLKHKKIN